MSAAFHIRASVVEQVPGGPDEGEYQKVIRDLGEAIREFTMLVPYSEVVNLRFSS